MEMGKWKLKLIKHIIKRLYKVSNNKLYDVIDTLNK